MSLHLLYFHLIGAERFERIHGEDVSRVARSDLTRRLDALARVLLRQHDVVSGMAAPEFGIWAIPFETKRLEIEADEREQLDSIAAAGSELARLALVEELGSAVALHARLEVGTLDAEGPDNPERWLPRLRERLRRAPPPREQASADERRSMLDVIGRRVELLLQEIVSLDTREPAAYEALLRGLEGSSLRGPDRLFEEAARCGLREALELASLDAALELARRLPAGRRLAINLSPDLYGAPAVRRLSRARDLSGRLILEITEHLPIPEPARLLEELRPLRRRGAKIALDDAGCGYLNMELVRALKPDIVKLCITVTRRIGGGPGIAALVGGTVASIRAAGASALAEGVENEAQARLARECGCSLAQGYYFSRPRAGTEVLAELAASRVGL